MEIYVLVVAGFGVLVLLTAWLPMVLRALPLSLPICCVGIGAVTTGALIPVRSQWRHPYLKRTFCKTFAFTSI